MLRLISACLVLLSALASGLASDRAVAAGPPIDRDVDAVVQSLSRRIDDLKADIANVTQQFNVLNTSDASAEIARIDEVLNKLEGIGDYIATDSPLVKSVNRWQTALKRELATLVEARQSYGDEFVAATRKTTEQQLKAAAGYLDQLDALHSRVTGIVAELRKNRNALSLLMKLDKSDQALNGLGKLIQDLNATVTEIEKLAPRFGNAGT